MSNNTFTKTKALPSIVLLTTSHLGESDGTKIKEQNRWINSWGDFKKARIKDDYTDSRIIYNLNVL